MTLSSSIQSDTKTCVYSIYISVNLIIWWCLLKVSSNIFIAVYFCRDLWFYQAFIYCPEYHLYYTCFFSLKYAYFYFYLYVRAHISFLSWRLYCWESISAKFWINLLFNNCLINSQSSAHHTRAKEQSWVPSLGMNVSSSPTKVLSTSWTLNSVQKKKYLSLE